MMISDQGRELLRQAIRAGAIAVMTADASTSEDDRVILRLVPALSSAGGAAAVITADVEEGRSGLIDQWIESKAAVSVSVAIKTHWAAVAFQTTVLSQQRRLLRRRLTLRAPARVTVEQRRRAPRERVPQDVRVQALLARRPFHDPAAVALPAEVWDLSLTGVCLWCRAEAAPADLKPGDAVALKLSYNGAEHPLTARYRHRQAIPNGGVRLGLEFDPALPALPDAATAEAIRALIDVLAQLRIRRESEQFVTRTLGLAG